MDAEPTQLYSQELVYPLAENPIHFIHSEKKLPIKVLKLFLLISSKKKRRSKNVFARKPAFEKLLTRFFFVLFGDVLKRYPVIHSKMCKILLLFVELAWVVVGREKAKKPNAFQDGKIDFYVV